MKSEIKEVPKVSNKPFPKLMIMNQSDPDLLNKKVILFAWFGTTSNISGVIIHGNSPNYKIGYNSIGWNPMIFEDYNGEITLSND